MGRGYRFILGGGAPDADGPGGGSVSRADDRVSVWRSVARGVLAAVLAMLAMPYAVSAKKKPAESRPPSVSFHWAAVPGGDRVIEVYGVNGNIRATHSDSETLFVDTVKRGQKSDPDEVRVSAELTGNGARVCARYPSPSGDLAPCGPDQRVGDSDVIVDITLRVPPGASLIARTVNGSIGGVDMQGPVEATTVNGGIDVVSTHRVVASTVNGTIDVILGPLGWAEPMSYTTTNGSVLLRIPGNADAVIDARSAEGRVDCELTLATTETRDRQHLVGTLGKGGTRLRLETVKGNVEVLPQ